MIEDMIAIHLGLDPCGPIQRNIWAESLGKQGESTIRLGMSFMTGGPQISPNGKLNGTKVHRRGLADWPYEYQGHWVKKEVQSSMVISPMGKGRGRFGAMC
jgi:hypothetical protein